MNQQKRNWKRKLISAALAVCLAASLSVCTFAETPTMNIQQNAEYTVTEAQIIDGVVFDPGEKILVITQDNSTYSPADSDGTMPILSTPSGGTWKQDNTGWWFQYPNGTYPKNKWEVIDNYWYYFKADGYMATGNITYQANWYYLTEVASPDHPLGSMYMNAWKKGTGTNWYYYGDTGAMLINKWVKTDGEYYFVGKSGAMLTDQWITTDNKKYYYVNPQGIWKPENASYTIERCIEGYFDFNCHKFTGDPKKIKYITYNLEQNVINTVIAACEQWNSNNSYTALQKNNSSPHLKFGKYTNTDSPATMASTYHTTGPWDDNWNSMQIYLNYASNIFQYDLINQKNILAHEIGHAVGLGHNPDWDSAVCPFYKQTDHEIKPTPEDLTTLRHVYN